MPSVIYHPAYRSYSFGDDHPFSPLRLDMMLELCAALGHPLETVAPEPAAREDLLGVHEEYYVRRVEALGAGEDVPDARTTAWAPPTPRPSPAWTRRPLARGRTLQGARRIVGGEKRVLQLGGGLHHARRNFASGFCVYNDLAIAIH